MIANNDLQRRLARYYDSEPPMRAPDWVLQSALSTIESTPQRRGLPALRRYPDLSTYSKLAAAAAAVVLAVGGFALWQLGPGGPGTQRTPPPFTAAPSPSGVSNPLRIPAVAGAPRPLEAGMYLSPTGFEPEVSVTLPSGWYGGGSAREFGIGQGLDEVAERYRDVGLSIARIDMPYDDALAAFSELGGLIEDREPATQVIGGFSSTTFYVHAAGGQVLLGPIAPGTDIHANTAHVTFVDVNGATLMLRGEVFLESAAGQLDAVIATMTFTP